MGGLTGLKFQSVMVLCDTTSRYPKECVPVFNEIFFRVVKECPNFYHWLVRLWVYKLYPILYVHVLISCATTSSIGLRFSFFFVIVVLPIYITPYRCVTL